MEQPPPLTPQEMAARQTVEYANVGQPQTVKVFGIMHIVLGAYGVLATVLAIIGMLGINLFALMPMTAGTSAQFEQQAAMQSELMPVSIISIIITIATTVFILMGGILMLKRRRSGLRWSNRYAWTSLAGKVFNAGVAILYTIPMMKEMTSGMGSPGMPGGMEGVMIGSMIFGIVITCLYPILTLVLLNRPTTKAWFAAQPE